MDVKAIMEMMKNPNAIKDEFIKPRLLDASKALLEDINKIESERDCGENDFVGYFFAKDDDANGGEIACFIAVMSEDGYIKEPIKKLNRNQVIELMLQSI